MMNKMIKLINKLNDASKLYYQNNVDNITDFEYDKMYDELLELEKETNIMMSNSPTQKIGYEVLKEFKKEQHLIPMMSLDKTKEIDKLVSFVCEEDALLSLKLDGIALVLTYENGCLIKAVTRGNGYIGENVTHNAKVFKNIPLNINNKEKLIIRGEAVISFKDFSKINNNLTLEEKYKNPRNLCSGSVRQLNSAITKDRFISFIVFELVQRGEKSTFTNTLKSENLNFIESLGFEIVKFNKVSKTTIENAINSFEKYIKGYKYATDGLVITFDNIEYGKSLGNTVKFPKDAIALKWEDELAETTLLKVEWNLSRTGLINPIAIFEPVELEGTTIRKASLHNLSIVENLKLGIGDTLTVYKANMIIPQIGENLTKSDTLVIPNICLKCFESIEVIKTKEGKALHCKNKNCEGKIIQSITHFVSRDAMNLPGISEAIIEKFLQNNIIKNEIDIYTLKSQKEEILKMDGFGETSYLNIIKSIYKSIIDRANNPFVFDVANSSLLENIQYIGELYKIDEVIIYMIQEIKTEKEEIVFTDFVQHINLRGTNLLISEKFTEKYDICNIFKLAIENNFKIKTNILENQSLLDVLKQLKLQYETNNKKEYALLNVNFDELTKNITEMNSIVLKIFINSLIVLITKNNAIRIHMHNFIYALGIDSVGLSNAKLICKYFDNNIESIINADIQDFIEIYGIGEITAASIFEYFRDKNNIEKLEKLRKYIHFYDISENNVAKELENKTFVITGSLVKFKNRKTLQDLLENKGAKISSSISLKTNYLVNNDITSRTGKNKKAIELNIPIISEETLIARFNL